MTRGQFNLFVFICLLAFPLASFLLHWWADQRTRFGAFKIVQVGYAGSIFPTFVVLLLGLVYPEARDVLTGHDVFLALAGFAGVVMTLTALFLDR